jgi:hypothetical protein
MLPFRTVVKSKSIDMQSVLPEGLVGEVKDELRCALPAPATSSESDWQRAGI